MALTTTVLGGAVAQGAIQVTLASFTNPSTGSIGPGTMLLVDEASSIQEYMRVEDASLSPTLLVTRGANGTLANAHSVGAKVRYGLTSDFSTTPPVSVQSQPQVAVVSLAGAAWNTGTGAALYQSWQNTTGGTVVITRVMIKITTASTGAATLAAGTTATNNHTTADNLIDDYNLQTVGVYSNLNKTDTEVDEITLANNAWVTFKASADPTGTVGDAYISFYPAATS